MLSFDLELGFWRVIMCKCVCDFIKSHFDFKFYGTSWICLAVFISIFPMLIWMPQKYGFENGLLENIQMSVLFIAVYLGVTSKVNQPLFRFIALALSILIIREVNCGRTLFFPIPGEYHKYYSWSMLPWPWLGKTVHFLYGTWIAIVSLIFLKKKFYLDIWKMIKGIKLPVWNLFFMCLAMFMGAIAEKATNNNFIFEEAFELLFYVSFAGIIWLYSRNDNFKLSEENEPEN